MTRTIGTLLGARLLLSGVPVEKLLFGQNRQNLGGYEGIQGRGEGEEQESGGTEKAKKLVNRF